MRLLFTPQAREAVEKVKVVPYVERVAASDNLRFALDGGDQGSRPAGIRPRGQGSRPAETARAIAAALQAIL